LAHLQVSGVACQGDYALVAAGETGVMVFDVTNPMRARFLRRVRTAGSAQGIVLAGGLALVTEGESGVQTIDINDPNNPRVLGSADTPGRAIKAAISGSYAYVADGEAGVSVVEITDPSNPRFIEEVDTAENAEDVAVSGSYAYVLDAHDPVTAGGLSVFSIEDPAHPALVSTVGTQPAWDITIRGSYAYIASQVGMQIIDISDPATPRIVGGHESNWTISVAVTDSMTWFGTEYTAELRGVPLQCDGRRVATGVAIPERAGTADTQAGPSTAAVPARLRLVSAFPNPSLRHATVRLSLPYGSHVVAEIFNASGDRVRRLYDGALDGGEHDLPWNGLDDAGRPVPGGVYLARLSCGGIKESARIVLVR
jgi:hypothetical protein